MLMNSMPPRYVLVSERAAACWMRSSAAPTDSGPLPGDLHITSMIMAFLPRTAPFSCAVVTAGQPCAAARPLWKLVALSGWPLPRAAGYTP